MKSSYEFEQKDFDALLRLLSPDREEAGEQYEHIRNGLVRFFHFKGCTDPLLLADETITRVAARVHSFDASRDVKPTSYFYGFASNILLEYKRKAHREVELGEIPVPDRLSSQADAEARDGCLQECLGALPERDRDLIIEYYTRERREKIEFRRSLCEKLKCRPPALHTKVFRIRSGLRTCIEDCIGRSR